MHNRSLRSSRSSGRSGRSRSIRRVVAHSLAALALGSLLSAPTHATEVGKPAPEFQLPAADKSIKLADYRGKVVLLDFWASWCGPCKQSFPWMNEMQSKYGAQGLVVLAVNVDQKREDAQKFLAEVPAKFTVVFDDKGTTPKAYAIKTMPSSMLIGADGMVKDVHRGFRGEDAAALEAKIRAALGQAK